MPFTFIFQYLNGRPGLFLGNAASTVGDLKRELHPTVQVLDRCTSGKATQLGDEVPLTRATELVVIPPLEGAAPTQEGHWGASRNNPGRIYPILAPKPAGAPKRARHKSWQENLTKGAKKGLPVGASPGAAGSQQSAAPTPRQPERDCTPAGSAASPRRGTRARRGSLYTERPTLLLVCERQVDGCVCVG